MIDLPLTVCATLTCHNRKEKTVNCIRKLKEQRLTFTVDLKIILVDDGSSDGTSDAVQDEFPDVEIIRGDGSLFWNRGMHLAIERATTYTPNFLLWVNDDTIIHHDALESLLKTHYELKPELNRFPIVTGSIIDPANGSLAYGGSVRTSRLLPLRFKLVEPKNRPVKCDIFNGNFVLIPFETYALIGNLDPNLIHNAGDYEYALRAEKAGISVWIAPGYHGECQTNPTEGTWMDLSIPLGRRFKLLLSTKGQPLKTRYIYYRKHGGPLWLFVFPLIYIRPLIHSIQKLFSRDN